MTIKLDENLGTAAAVSILAAAGHDVTTVPQQGLCGSTDRGLFEVCRAEHRILVTLDLDFSNPLRFDPSHHEGVAVLRLPAKSSRTDLLAAVRTLATRLDRSHGRGWLWVVEPGLVREYRPE